MEWLNSLFVQHSPLQAVIILAIIIALGLGLGKLRICGISLGMTCVFFAGILVGHLGFSIDPNMLKYAESFGLVLFVFERIIIPLFTFRTCKCDFCSCAFCCHNYTFRT